MEILETQATYSAQDTEGGGTNQQKTAKQKTHTKY